MQENNYAELEDETASGGERAKQTERPINPQQHQQQPQKPIQSQSSTSSSASNSASKKDKSKKSKDVSLILIRDVYRYGKSVSIPISILKFDIDISGKFSFDIDTIYRYIIY